MWAVAGCRGLRARLLSISRLTSPFPFHYSGSSFSTQTADDDEEIKNKSSELMVNYLINSVGLSRDEAIFASSKVSHLKSTINPDLVINILKHLGGLDQTQLKDVVFSVPRVLLHKPKETLEPKIRVLQELGLTGSHLVKIIKNTSILGKGLDTSIIPTISYLRNVLGGCDDKVVKALCKRRLISSKPFNLMPPNIDLLRSYGFSQENIQRMIIKDPYPLMIKTERLRDLLHTVEVEWGAARGSSAFLQAITILCDLTSSTLESKFAVFRSFGWSDSNILLLARTMALIFGYSESSLQLRLHFFMEELGCTPAYLASHPAYLGYSLEKRVKPRHEVIKILKRCNLVKCDLALHSFLCISEVKFVEKFVLPYKEEVADLYETYANYKKQQSEA